MIRRRKAKKILLFMSIVFSFLSLRLYLELREVNNLNALNVADGQKHDDSNNKNNLYYETNQWMFNNRLFQYSSHLFVKHGVTQEIDSIIMTTEEYNDVNFEKEFVCLIKSMKTGKKYIRLVTKIFSFRLSNSKRIKCNIQNLNLEPHEISVAVINKNDFKDVSINLANIDAGKMFFEYDEFSNTTCN